MQGFVVWKGTVLASTKPAGTYSYGKTVLPTTDRDTASVTDKAILLEIPL